MHLRRRPAATAPFSLIAAEDRALLPAEIEDAYPLTRMQAGMLFHSASAEDTAFYHNIFSYHLQGPYEPEAMRAADITLVIDDALLLGVSGGALLLAAGGLLALRRWAWTLAMSTQCLILTFTLYEYLAGEPEYFLTTLGVLSVLLLNRQEVRLAVEPPGQPHG